MENFRRAALITVFLCVGPLVLPLIWFNPRFSLKIKIIASAIIIPLSYYMTVLFLDSLKSLNSYYKTVFSNL